jgi:murein DD-endopeptidase MepM/ murein hydrolase activator NlpD
VAWLVAPLLLLRFLALALPSAATFVLASALAAPVVEEPRWRLAVGVVAALAPGLLLRWRVAVFLARRGRRVALGVEPTLAIVNLAVAAGLVLGFADDMGRALRRHGDWFVGERHGFVARTVRAGISGAAGALERFEPTPELGALPPPPGPGPEPAPRPAWVHPLAGPARVLPASESQRFGAARPQPRPAECELGHCGVDLVGPVGLPVHAVADGVVARIETDAFADARSGRYLVLAHEGGAAGSRYIHLDTIAPGLRPGDPVAAGQVIGTLGATGIQRSAAHLHFALTVRRDGRDLFVDPEPLLRRWTLVDATPPVAAATR